MASPSMSTMVSVRRVSISCFWFVVEHTLDELHVRRTACAASSDSSRSGISGRPEPAPGPLQLADKPPATRWSSGLQAVRHTSDVDFRVLGSVGIVDGTALLPLGGGMPRRLLAVLLAYRTSVVSTDRLVEVLWAEPPESAAAHAPELRVAAPAVRGAGRRRRRHGRTARPATCSRCPTTWSTPAASSAAWPRARTCSARDPVRRARRCSTPRWPSGGATRSPSSPTTEWIRPEAVRLEELRLVAAEALVDAELRVGRHQRGGRPARGADGRAPAAGAVRPAADARPLPLGPAGARRCGSRSEFRTTLRDDLGLEPSGDAARARGRDPRGARRARVGAAATVAAPERAGRRVDAASRPARGDDAARRPRRRPRAGRAAARRPVASSPCSAPAAWARPASPTGWRTPSRRRSPTACAGRARPGARRGRGHRRGRRRARRAAAAAAGRSPTRSSSVLAPQPLLLVLDNCEHVLDTASELVELVLQWCPRRAGARHQPGAARHPRRGGVVGAAAAGAERRRPAAGRPRRGPRGAAVRGRRRRGAARLRPRRRQPRAPSPRSASGSTACRSRSSWRRRACGR